MPPPPPTGCVATNKRKTTIIDAFYPRCRRARQKREQRADGPADKSPKRFSVLGNLNKGGIRRRKRTHVHTARPVKAGLVCMGTLYYNQDNTLPWDELPSRLFSKTKGRGHTHIHNENCGYCRGKDTSSKSRYFPKTTDRSARVFFIPPFVDPSHPHPVIPDKHLKRSKANARTSKPPPENTLFFFLDPTYYPRTTLPLRVPPSSNSKPGVKTLPSDK